MPVKHLLSLGDLSPDVVLHLVDRAVAFSASKQPSKVLKDKIVGIYFSKSSTRTRTSFAVGAMKLGADTIIYGAGDLQLCTGETLTDTSRVLSGYLDGLVVRTNGPQAEMAALCHDQMAVINAMSQEEHPTQAIGDLGTLKECFGHLDGLRVLYLGDGNNTTTALARACSIVPGMEFHIVTPEGHGIDPSLLAHCHHRATANGGKISQQHSINALPSEVDAVYTTRWQTMGEGKPGDDGWKEKFQPYRVDQELMGRVSKADGSTIFMHDLPAVRGEDVTDAVLDSKASWAWRQANFKLYSAMAVLEWCFAG